MAFIKERSLATLLTELKKWVAAKAEAVFSVNGVLPEDGDVAIDQVEYARNLISEGVQTSAGEYIARTSGGAASIDDGDAWIVRLTGRRTHTGVVPEVLEMAVNAAPRPEPEEGDPDPGTITAVIDKAVFRAYVDESGTTTLEYTDSWSEDPTLYGITVSGTPINGDEIVIQYTKEDRGTITQSTPTRFISEGWNLYNSVTGYAKVIKYSEAYGFRIVGDYTGLKYSETVEGTKTTITVADGLFSVPGDGFVWVEGGSAANTAIWMTWSDWTDTYAGDFTPYTVDTIDLTSVMQQRFPNGLMQAGSAADIIDLNTQTATSWIERLVYTEQNLADIQASGREYEADENYIYAVRQTPVTHAITIDGGYTVSDHGLEIIDGTTVPVFAETLYGNNLKNKLERDVLTISQQTLGASQQLQARANVGAAKAVTVDMGTISSLPVTKTATGVTAKMVVAASELGTPSAQTGDWTITTAADSVTISGTISGSTTVKLVLIEQDAVTATTS